MSEKIEFIAAKDLPVAEGDEVDVLCVENGELKRKEGASLGGGGSSCFIVPFSELLDLTSTFARCINLELFRACIEAEQAGRTFPSVYINSWGNHYGSVFGFDSLDWENEEENYNAVQLTYINLNGAVASLSVYPSQEAYENDL